MFYTVYRVINLQNGKEYIGKHQTDNLEDGYMGSGKYLKRAIQKYGIENFKKEILYVFETEDEMNAKEAELVTEEYCDRKDTYNICSGGKGGFGYINKVFWTEEKRKDHCRSITPFKLESFRKKYRKHHEKALEKARKIAKELRKKGTIKNEWWIGRQHTEEAKLKVGMANSIKQKGSRNSQYGTMWITNGKENRKIKKELDTIPEGWYKGRTINKGTL